MQLPVQMAAWCTACGIVVFALGAAPQELSFQQPVLSAQTQASCEEADCVPASPALRPAPALEDPFSPAPAITPDAFLLPLVLEAPSFPLPAPAPPRNAPEEAEHAREAGGDEQQAREAQEASQDTPIAGLLKNLQTQEQRLAQHDRVIAMLTSGQEQLTKTIAIAFGGVCLLGTLGAFYLWRSPRQTLLHAGYPAYSRRQNATRRLQLATCSLSAPKQEDVILTDFAPRRYTLVLADGASSYLGAGGELSGGGRQAAEIAAHTAITYLSCHLHPPMCLDGMLAVLGDCFAAANAALERHNRRAATPGGTTLLIGLLCQAADGKWYWLYGNVGNGVLAVIHAKPLLAGWPIATPLLSKQANGTTTITLPGNAKPSYPPAVGVRPHHPGDMLVLGSDGLDCLDTVTKKSDKLSFLNFLFKTIQEERASLERGLHALQQGREDAAWQNALALDDTTIGILWA